jgi:uncharacterized MnhB-related membrane protein
MMFELVQALPLTGVVGSALMAVKTRDLLLAVLFLGFMSLLLSVEFYILQAPDVAIAEAGIGAGLTTAIYMIAIKKTTRWEDAND